MMNHKIRIIGLILGAVGCLLLAAGCNSATSMATDSSGNAPTPSAPGASVPAPPQGTEATTVSDEETQLADLEKKLKANPGDAALKKEVAEVSYQVGHTMMLNPDLQPRVKYRGALKHFRRTLALQPGHEYAAAEKKQIEDVYRSMGMAVPQ